MEWRTSRKKNRTNHRTNQMSQFLSPLSKAELQGRLETIPLLRTNTVALFGIVLECCDSRLSRGLIDGYR
jgi:hypothetical protein